MSLLATKQSKFQLFHFNTYVSLFGQTVLWTSLPDRATKKKENRRSLNLGYR